MLDIADDRDRDRDDPAVSGRHDADGRGRAVRATAPTALAAQSAVDSRQ
jgi:hypothetical protein